MSVATHPPRATRLRRLAIVGGIALAAVAAAIASSSGGATPKVKPVESSLLAGIPERDGVLGDPKAKVTVTEFLDLQCPICAEAARTTLPTLLRDDVRTGQVKLEARTLQFIGPDSVVAARAAAGAQAQGKLWPFLAAFYANQGQENSGYVTDAFLRRVAGAAGVNADDAFAGADSQFAQRRLDRANADAQRLGIDSTPTFTVAKGSGAAHVLEANALDPSSVAAALDAELDR